MLNLELTEHSNNVEILIANVDLVKNSGTRSYKLLHFLWLRFVFVYANIVTKLIKIIF